MLVVFAKQQLFIHNEKRVLHLTLYYSGYDAANTEVARLSVWHSLYCAIVDTFRRPKMIREWDDNVWWTLNNEQTDWHLSKPKLLFNCVCSVRNCAHTWTMRRSWMFSVFSFIFIIFTNCYHYLISLASIMELWSAAMHIYDLGFSHQQQQ